MSEKRIELGSSVVISVSGEAGVVIGRCDYLVGETQYQLRYKCADGRATEAWWPVSAIELIAS